jgi:ABC-type amino acid transport substrate-binding protein
MDLLYFFYFQILVTQDSEIREVEISDFYLEGRTLSAGSLCGKTVVVQAHSTGLKTLTHGKNGKIRKGHSVHF